jgi:hypothetical protein
VNDAAKQYWMPLLQRLSAVMLRSDFAEEFSEEAISTGCFNQWRIGNDFLGSLDTGQ